MSADQQSRAQPHVHTTHEEQEEQEQEQEQEASKQDKKNKKQGRTCVTSTPRTLFSSAVHGDPPPPHRPCPAAGCTAGLGGR